MFKKINSGGYSESINMLRFPLAVLVVFVHSFGEELNVGVPCEMTLSGEMVYEYIRIMCSKVIAHGAVPAFFFISGFLFFLKVTEFKKCLYVEKLKKRLHSLAVPYVSWILLYLCYIFSFKIGGVLLHGKPWSEFIDYLDEKGWIYIFWDSNVWDERTNWFGWETFYSGPVPIPLWYMRDLMIIVLLSPAIYYSIKRLKGYFVLLTGLLYCSYIALPIFSATIMIGLFFFSFGAYFSIKGKDFTDALWRYRYILVFFSITGILVLSWLGSISGGAAAQWLYHFVIISETLTFLAIASALCHNERLYYFNKNLAPTTFFIYAFHIFILGYCITGVNKILNNDIWYMQILAYLISPVLCVTICIALYFLLRRSCPKMLGVLTGERK